MPERQLVLVVESIVEPNIVFALILRIVAVQDDVVRALTETGCRERKRIQHRHSYRTQAVRWNDVAGEGLSGCGIHDYPNAGESVVWIEQLAEVPVRILAVGTAAVFVETWKKFTHSWAPKKNSLSFSFPKGIGPPTEYAYCLKSNGAGPLFSNELGLRLRAQVFACNLSSRR